MKTYDLIIQGKREMDISIADKLREYEIIVVNRRNIDLIVENLQNRVTTYIRHSLRLTENIPEPDVHGGRYIYISHPIRINVADINVHLDKTISNEDNTLHLISRVSASIGQNTSTEPNTLRMNCTVSAQTSRLRLLLDVDNMTLGEMDDMTLEELDYLKG